MQARIDWELAGSGVGMYAGFSDMWGERGGFRYDPEDGLWHWWVTNRNWERVESESAGSAGVARVAVEQALWRRRRAEESNRAHYEALTADARVELLAEWAAISGGAGGNG